MSDLRYPLRYIATVSIEFETPFIIGGDADFLSDSAFITDVNQLPTIPGSSIAGVLRHLCVDAFNDASKIESIFGYQANGLGQGSRLAVSFGCIHDSANFPVEGRVAEARLGDPVLLEAQHAFRRDHVQINHRGKAENKFDEIKVSAGHRFTFELELEGIDEDNNDWQTILGILKSDSIRIGGKTRRGYGAFKVIALDERKFDLRLSQEFQEYSCLQVSFAGRLPGQKLDLNEHLKDKSSITAEFCLKPDGFWMIGSGIDDEADMSPVLESRIKWMNNHGEVTEDEVLVPATSIKGALSHRVAYYYNLLTHEYSEGKSQDEIAQKVGSNNQAVKQLFGFSRDTQDGSQGIIILNDIFVEQAPVQKVLNHVSLDRFTGGAKTMTGALFSEKPFYGGESFSLKLVVQNPPKDIDADAVKALRLSLGDLSKGLLPIGSGSGRGNGFMMLQGNIKWSDGGIWINGGQND